MSRLAVAAAASTMLAVSADAQGMTVSTAALTLAAPDTLAYDGGGSPPGALSVMVTACAGALGCRLTIENPNATSLIPIEVQWRLASVSQVGAGTLGCSAMAPTGTWRSMPTSPEPVMDTGLVTVAGTGCTAVVEVRAVNLSYAAHQVTSPATTYWRDLLFRTVEK